MTDGPGLTEERAAKERPATAAAPATTAASLRAAAASVSGRPIKADSASTADGRARYRRIVRFAQRAMVQIWWFEIFLPRIRLGKLSERGRTARMQRLARRFHALAVELGGLMIKVGQFLSSRLDVLPPEITAELEGLQDEVPAVAFPAIRAQAEAELGMPLWQAYASFDETPIAAASFGQAHRATLTPALAEETGYSRVVVKVQRPGIEDLVATDLRALRRVGQLLKRVELVSKRADAPALVEEFAATSLEEIDYIHEGSSAERFAADFETDPRVGAAQVVWERTASRILTLSDVTAIKITDVDALRAAGIDPIEVANELARATFQQLFVAGFFHADPHPGNIFVTPLATPRIPARAADADEGTPEQPAPVTWELTYIDFGMMGVISDTLRASLRQLIFAIVSRDGPGLVRSMRSVGVLLPAGDTMELEQAMTELFGRFGGMGVAELQRVDPAELGDFADRFRDTIREMPFQLPENFLLIIRAISLVSGVTSALDKDFNMWEAVDPFARTLTRDEGGNTIQAVAKQAVSALATAVTLPGRLDALTTRLEAGQLKVQTPSVDRHMRSLERMLRGVVSAIVFAALLIAGVLVLPQLAPLGIVLMSVSVVPLLHAVAVAFGRRRR